MKYSLSQFQPLITSPYIRDLFLERSNLIMPRILLLLLLFSHTLLGQRQPMKLLPLNDLTAFQPQAGNWSVAGQVHMHPFIDIHDDLESAVRVKPGTGVLINQNDDSLRDQLLTRLEHGDIILDLEVMLPKGSNSGIYLQGRYEVQLLDSWGVQQPTYGDIGGIYRNWPNDVYPDYLGKAPLSNAAKAPGLWQHMRIAFQAPRFDSDGGKVQNAKMVYVDLNGVRIHNNVEIPAPTGGSVELNEVPKGPLMIQGDHGPVAFRNIRYQLMEAQPVHFSNLRYEIYEGAFDRPSTVGGDSVSASGTMAQFTVAPAMDFSTFGMRIQGQLTVAASGQYDFQLEGGGGVRLQVGGQSLEVAHSRRFSEPLELKLDEGTHDFELVYYKREGWFPTRLAWYNLTAHPAPMHALSSFPPPSGSGAIVERVGQRPRLLRAFLDYENNREDRLTHTIGVGTPQGAHYVYDLKAGTPVCIWRGGFVDATPMWNGRGDGSFSPLGSPVYLPKGHSVAPLSTPTASFPEGLSEAAGFRNVGYEVDPKTGHPVFLYEMEGASIRDEVLPGSTGKGLVRHLHLEGSTAPFFVRLAAGENIRQLQGGLYEVDQKYYIELPQGINATLREIGGKSELLLPLHNQIEYTINW